MLTAYTLDPRTFDPILAVSTSPAPPLPGAASPRRTMDGVLNVRDLGAVGDGITDDRLAIQMAVNALASPAGNAVYFPQGEYRIDGSVEMNALGSKTGARGRLHRFRLFGETGRGAVTLSPATPVSSSVTAGPVLRQHVPDVPTFVFRITDTWGWEIDGLGFEWATPANPPPWWQARDFRDGAGCSSAARGSSVPGSVAILFSGIPDESAEVGVAEIGYYNNRISRCSFEEGWRGVAIDETYAGLVAVWNTQIEHCTFRKMTGAAFCTLNGAAGGIGMPNNSIRNTLIQCFDDRPNQEEMLILAQQGNFTAENVNFEGSYKRVVSCYDCTAAFRSISVEHAVILGEDYPKLFYFGGGQYRVDIIGIDGWMRASTLGTDPQTGASTVFNVEGVNAAPSTPGQPAQMGNPASLVLSGVRALPHDVTDPNPEKGGFIPTDGPAFLVGGSQNATYRVLNQPQMPIYSDAKRALWSGNTGNQPKGPYREFTLWGEGWTAPPMSLVVDAPATFAAGEIGGDAIAAGTVYADSISAPGARRGNIVQLGTPADYILPTALVPLGLVVQDDWVEVRLYNSSPTAIMLPVKRWTATAGGGPNAGGPVAIIPD